MKILYNTRINFDNRFSTEGFILIYENRLEIGTNIDHMAKEMAKKSKFKLTDILANGVQLVYSKDKENVYISENRKMDVFRLSAKSINYHNLLEEEFK